MPETHSAGQQPLIVAGADGMARRGRRGVGIRSERGDERVEDVRGKNDPWRDGGVVLWESELEAENAGCVGTRLDEQNAAPETEVSWCQAEVDS